MKGGGNNDSHNSFLQSHVEQCDREQQQSTTTMTMLAANMNGGGSTTAASSPASLSLCSTPSTSSGSIQITRSTTTPLSQGKKYIDVQLLTREHLYLAVDVKCKIGEIYRYVCSKIGLQYVSLFGLTHFIENEYRFCDQDERLSKYAPKNWPKAPGWGTDLVGNPSVILYLRVHTYVDYVRLINCPISLLHYYLQLRENVRIQWEPSWVPEERCFETAALALQSDFGDYRSDKHETGYFRPDAYFPIWVINSRGMDYVLRHLPSIHHDLEGLDPYEARVRYCREATRPPCPVNMHLYRLRRTKTDAQDTVYLGVTSRGLELFEQKASGDRQHLISFTWSKIGKLAFDRRKFTLSGLDGQKMVFYTCSDEKSRYLLNFCRAVHQNVIRLQPIILEARRREAEERKQFRESYIYSDTADLDWIRKADSSTTSSSQTPSTYYEYNLMTQTSNSSSYSRSLMTSMSPGGGGVGVVLMNGGGILINAPNGNVGGGGGGQRVSLVSDASSNTTSGIVSDRQHTHDDSENENEGDGDFEITTGCDSSPLVSELSLATSGSSPPLCGSQQVSPIAGGDSGIVSRGEEDDRERVASICGSSSIDRFVNVKGRRHEDESGADGDDEEAGEGGSSVGPCSDRTVTAAADDTQSTETTSTTGKLEDLCTEPEFAGAPAANVFPTDDRTRQWAIVDDQHHPHKRGSINNGFGSGAMSIAELRRQTLHDYAGDRQGMFQRRASPPILPLPPPLLSNHDESAAQPNQPPIIAQDQPGVATFMKSLSAAPTSNGHLSTSNQEFLGGPMLAERPRSYRIVGSQSSNELGVQNGDAIIANGFVNENRSTPSPPRLETLIMEPPPPPPYPYELEQPPACMENNNIAQSYSSSNLPSSSSSSFGRNGSALFNERLQQPQQPLPQQLQRMQRTSADGLPNYEQALRHKMELEHRLATSTNLEQSAASSSSVPWLHTATAKRWPTVSGIHPTVLDQLVNAIGMRRLQQAQSEPGLAAHQYCGATSADDYFLNRRCGHQDAAARFVGSAHGAPSFPYAPSSDAFFDGGVAGAYRSVSTYHLSATGGGGGMGGLGRTCTCQHHCGLPSQPLQQHSFHQSLHQPFAVGQFATPPPACTPNGLYVKQPRPRSTATAAGHRMHTGECQQQQSSSASQLLYNGQGGGGNKAVARVHSMYEAAKADQVRRSLEYEYYRRFEQQVVQTTRRELRKKQLELQLAASMSSPSANGQTTTSHPSVAMSSSQELLPPPLPTTAPSSSMLENGDSSSTSSAHLPTTTRLAANNIDHDSADHSAPGHYCESCQENHTAGKIDLAQLKDIIRAQNVDLPLMRALCNDRTVGQVASADSTPPTKPILDDSAAHPLLRQKKTSAPAASSRRPHPSSSPPLIESIGSSTMANNGRPLTWHESLFEMRTVGSSSWPSSYE